jgi:hypothetical protein
MMALSSVLTSLIAVADPILRCPQAHKRAAPLFAELAAEVRRIDCLPAEGARNTRAGLIMVTAIEGFFADNGDDDSWLMLAGCALPLLRREAWQAMVEEKDARPAEPAGGHRR